MKINANEGEFEVPEGLVDRRIECREYRATRLENEDDDVGLLSLSFQVGDQLGEIYVTTQFEAKPGQSDQCQIGQNQFLLSSCDWMREILEQLADGQAGDWTVDLVPHKCPKTRVGIATDSACEVAAGTLGVEEARRRQLSTDLSALGEVLPVDPGVVVEVQRDLSVAPEVGHGEEAGD